MAQPDEQSYEYEVKITCPDCGGVAGRVLKVAGEQREVRLQPGNRQGQCMLERGCGPLTWPSENEVQRAADRAARKPHRPGKPYGGRAVTIRARRRAYVELPGGGRGAPARGTRLGT